MKGTNTFRFVRLSSAVVLLSLGLWFASATDDEQQPPPCWKHRVWGLRHEYDDRGDRCTAFIPTVHHLNRIASSSVLREVKKNDSIFVNNIDDSDRGEVDTSSSSSSSTSKATTFRKRSKDEWIDGRTMLEMEKAGAREEQVRQRQRELELYSNYQSPPVPLRNREKFRDTSTFTSRITYTDANTLEIELPPSGVNADTVFSGVFSALWFSAVGPATVGMLSTGGLASLFMVPFWYAGGLVAKTAVVDPFISSQLTIGDYLWTLEKNYFQSKGKLTSKKKEGPTENVSGASVEVGMVVNNVPRYELRLFLDGETISFGKGLSFEELEYLAETINEHRAKINETPRLQQ